MEKVQPLFSTQELAYIATVVKADQGLARLIRPSNGSDVTVCGHGSTVPVVRNGDQVLAVATADGAVVIDRLRACGELPTMANHDGRVIIESQSFIGLRVNNATLRLDAQGSVNIDAENASVAANVLAEIQAELVKLN